MRKLIILLAVVSIFFSFGLGILKVQVQAVESSWKLSVIDEIQKYKPTNLPEVSEMTTGGADGRLSLVIQIIDMLIYVAGILAVIAIIIGGAQYIFSFGWDQVEWAKRTILWAVVGLIAVMLSYAVVHNVVRIVVESSIETKQVLNEEKAEIDENEQVGITLEDEKDEQIGITLEEEEQIGETSEIEKD